MWFGGVMNSANIEEDIDDPLSTRRVCNPSCDNPSYMWLCVLYIGIVQKLGCSGQSLWVM